ncbi:DUF6756 family protein [Aureispira anguillae]|uniref:Uncharacterized protein n=1 Tax=Aureispira anguillae TaxID=2864201 RepID=A0A915YGR6_9BACT|nr:DUF6756 family protein [Aureispira anguillae]BDS12724.1 hypothetical protein AsAng_0034490 [Aureispira anguillae]
MTKNRHIKSKRKTTWTNLRVEIKKICDQLNISKDEFLEVNIREWKGIESKIWTRFSTIKNSRWIWESLIDDYSSISVNYETLDLESIIKSSEQVWFLLDETVNEQSKFWIYEGTINAFEKIFWESGYTDEILIVSKKYEWILIINHHDIMIGTGKMKHQIEELKK